MDNKDIGQQWVMRWIAFIVITALFVGTALKSIFKGTESDKIISGLFLVIVGFPWGASIWKFFTDKLK